MGQGLPTLTAIGAGAGGVCVRSKKSGLFGRRDQFAGWAQGPGFCSLGCNRINCVLGVKSQEMESGKIFWGSVDPLGLALD